MKPNKDDQAERPLMLTVKEACRLLGVSRTTMWSYAKKGHIKVVRIGTRGVRIPRQEVTKFVYEGVGEE